VKAKLDTGSYSRKICSGDRRVQEAVKKETAKNFRKMRSINSSSRAMPSSNSWNTPRPSTLPAHGEDSGFDGTAANVQAMVFGNMGRSSGTGVGFTRNPQLVKKHFTGEFLLNAQGEDVVAGIRTPQPIPSSSKSCPRLIANLHEITTNLEKALPAICKTRIHP